MDTLPKTYSRGFCDVQYDPFITAPDAAEINERRLALAADARAAFKAYDDIPYGSSGKEQLDIYPARGKSRAVLVFIHGGYWQLMDKKDFAFLANSFVNAGITLVLVNYNLAPAVTLDKIVSEVRAACAWVWHNIERYGGDRNRIYIAGNSAGAHLTATMAATEWQRLDFTLPKDLMKGGIGQSGLYDLEPLLYAHKVNDALKLDRSAALRNSPVHQRPTLRGPLLLLVGQLESAEFKRQTQLLHDTWRELPIRQMIVQGRHHFNILLELATEHSDSFRATLELMDLSGNASTTGAS
jgi:arylformamidase